MVVINPLTRSNLKKSKKELEGMLKDSFKRSFEQNIDFN